MINEISMNSSKTACSQPKSTSDLRNIFDILSKEIAESEIVVNNIYNISNSLKTFLESDIKSDPLTKRIIRNDF